VWSDSSGSGQGQWRVLVNINEILLSIIGKEFLD
jgi:hypothetical protein